MSCIKFRLLLLQILGKRLNSNVNLKNGLKSNVILKTSSMLCKTNCETRKWPSVPNKKVQKILIKSHIVLTIFINGEFAVTFFQKIVVFFFYAFRKLQFNFLIKFKVGVTASFSKANIILCYF